MEDGVVEAIAAIVDDVTADQVQRVLSALRLVREGAPVGTIAKDPETGAVAVRVTENGVPLWKVTAPDGGEWREMQPQLAGWELLGNN